MRLLSQVTPPLQESLRPFVDFSSFSPQVTSASTDHALYQGLVIFSGVDAEQARIGRDVKLKEFGDDVSDRVAVQRVIAGVDGFLVSRESVGAEEKELLTAFSHSEGFRDFAGLGWSLVVEHDKGDILGPVGPIKRFLMVISGTSILLALLISAFISSSISRRIKNLTKMAEDIARGELDIRADETQSQDEIGQLAVVFSEMSAALRDSYGRLEERVRQRTEELETANIGLEAQIVWRERVEKAMNQQAQELARSNAELEQFAYVASHDLQEPLRKVLAFGDLLHSRSDDALDDTGRNYLERMQDASRRMRALIEALLTYARVTSHGNPFVTVDLGEVTREVVSDLEVTIASSGGRVELGDLPSIEADPTQMRQLLQNLISNGLKFSRPGERPALAVHGQLLNGHAGSENDMPTAAVTRDKVQLTVADDGIGFDQKHADRIFTIFQRLHGRGEYEGTGIGLAIARKIVERHSGAITAIGRPGEGANLHRHAARPATE